MLVDGNDDVGLAAAALDRDGMELAGEEAVLVAGSVLLLRGEGEGVAVVTRKLIVASQIVGRLRHGFATELLLDRRVREARAEGRIEHLEILAKGVLGLADDKRRARHALDAARDDDIGLAAGDRMGRADDGVQARAAVA